MRVLLIRHGESEGNLNKAVYFEKPDHAIDLSDRGREQAVQCGRLLRERLDFTPQRFWVSPYARTRQTLAGILQSYPGADVRESVHLVEQQFGLFDGYPEEDLPKTFPVEHAHYQKAEDFEGRFWARMPLGESRFDVCQRVHQFFGSVQRDNDRHGIRDIAVVSHGVTIRAFIMMWCHKPWEWLENEPNPKNCSAQLIDDDTVRPIVIEIADAPTNEKTKAD
jgi:2,3-bisphosphoglycerate-dependent phosphoglycerate mutase